MNRTKIEWTEETWNPSIGCTKISAGCKNCYAEKMAIRLKSMGIPAYLTGFSFKILPDRLNEPLSRKKPTRFFVNSMSDLFHEKMPFEYLDKIFDVMRKTPYHIYQVLTKRENRMMEYFQKNNPPENLWLGVTVENKKQGVPRIQVLKNTPSKIKFLSFEPLLENIGIIDLSGIDWVIVGGESGYNARPMKESWVIEIRNQCLSEGIPFFFKQWGTWGNDMKKRNKKANGRVLQGKIWNEFPIYEKYEYFQCF